MTEFTIWLVLTYFLHLLLTYIEKFFSIMPEREYEYIYPGNIRRGGK